jgi:hypothetical protein
VPYPWDVGAVNDSCDILAAWTGGIEEEGRGTESAHEGRYGGPSCALIHSV